MLQNRWYIDNPHSHQQRFADVNILNIILGVKTLCSKSSSPCTFQKFSETKWKYKANQSHTLQVGENGDKNKDHMMFL